MLTSITPGSGVTCSSLQARVARRRVALQHHLHAQLGGRGFDGGEQLQVVLQPSFSGGMKT
jgi:hypothetical protein